MSNDDFNDDGDDVAPADPAKTHPMGSTWQFSWTTDYIVTVTGHARQGIKVEYRRPGSKDSKHTLKRGIFQPDELVPLPRQAKR